MEYRSFPGSFENLHGFQPGAGQIVGQAFRETDGRLHGAALSGGGQSRFHFCMTDDGAHLCFGEVGKDWNRHIAGGRNSEVGRTPGRQAFGEQGHPVTAVEFQSRQPGCPCGRVGEKLSVAYGFGTNRTHGRPIRPAVNGFEQNIAKCQFIVIHTHTIPPSAEPGKLKTSVVAIND